MLNRSNLNIIQESADFDRHDLNIITVIEGENKKYRHPPFVKKCVASITKNHDHDVSRAFAICQAQYKKGSKKSLNKRAAAQKDYKTRMNQYEKALKDARKSREKG